MTLDHCVQSKEDAYNHFNCIEIVAKCGSVRADIIQFCYQGQSLKGNLMRNIYWWKLT